MADRKSERKCSVPLCGKKHHAKNFCQKHYDEFLKRDRKQEHKEYNRTRRVKALKVVEKTRVSETIKQEGRSARNALYRARKYSVEAERIYKKDVFDECNWKCGICGLPVDKFLKYPNKLSASLDHIIPLAKGGKHVRKNVQLAHLLCNMKKHTK